MEIKNYHSLLHNTNGIISERKNNLNPIHYDDYTNWQTQNSKDYDNFMANTTAPQNNPFGITGNPAAMKKLELQKPERPTNQKKIPL